jgi:hypothetical protein
VLHVADTPAPTPGPNEILVKVQAAALNPVDWHLMRGIPFPIRMMVGGLRRPKSPRGVAAISPERLPPLEARSPDLPSATPCSDTANAAARSQNTVGAGRTRLRANRSACPSSRLLQCRSPP